MFVERAVADGDDYRVFWAALARGQFQSAEFKRVGNGGREVWIQASYNPILDANGKVYKVVKFASDITEQVKARQGVQATIGSVSQAVDQLNASIRDIAEVMARSRQAAQQTVESVSATGDNSAALASAAQAMAGVVDMINAITGQINLLALNATIESARAGEAGRGFAVVASEVKSLAGQARSATAKIAAEITQLRAVSDQVTAALTDIRAAINGVAGFVTSTSAAVDEQTAVTRDIAQSVQHLAREADRLVRAV
jgi:methyl-accepting chemotaxis protein